MLLIVVYLRALQRIEEKHRSKGCDIIGLWKSGIKMTRREVLSTTVLHTHIQAMASSKESNILYLPLLPLASLRTAGKAITAWCPIGTVIVSETHLIATLKQPRVVPK